MKSLRIIACSLVLTLCSASSALAGSDETQKREVVHMPKNEGYLDSDTKAFFPPSVQGFAKSEVVRGAGSTDGTAVRYGDTAGNCADIYIYTLPGKKGVLTKDDAATHYAECAAAVIALAGNKSSGIGKVKQLSGRDFSFGRLIAGKKGVFSIEFGGKKQRSVMAVFPFGERMIRVRITGDDRIIASVSDYFLDSIFRIFERAAERSRVAGLETLRAAP